MGTKEGEIEPKNQIALSEFSLIKNHRWIPEQQQTEASHYKNNLAMQR